MMLEKVYENIYRSQVPLPNNPLKALNSYIIKGKEKTVIIDTGFNCKESKEVFYGDLDKLKVDMKTAEVVITHLHADHSGLAHELAQKGAQIFMSRGDGEAAKRLREESNWLALKERLYMFGLEYDDKYLRMHPGRVYAPAAQFEFTVIKEADELVVDEYRFQVVEVPGHTPDMINLYECRHGIYFSADHVLDPITPNIGFWGFKHSVILNQYLNSLKKIYGLRINIMFPAHRKLITDHQRRIDQLLAHHEHRLQEIEVILTVKGRELTVVEVAKEMKWKIRAKNWDEFPPAQKVFAVGEAMSHLEYLNHRKTIAMKKRDGILYFSI
ncbi:MAG: MBL fold metallo-hydrolase [bacterium]|jgi:glyoxylase-like metal-dependent hydrolase (beta-lactamase superfamily II)